MAELRQGNPSAEDEIMTDIEIQMTRCGATLQPVASILPA
jgi:hypothetical protein